MTNKNHTIKSFRVSEETFKLFSEASEKISFTSSKLSRLLFNRALMQLKVDANKNGWDKLEFSVKELN